MKPKIKSAQVELEFDTPCAIVISRDVIESGKVKPFIKFLDNIEKQFGKKARNKLVLLFEGSENFEETRKALMNYFIFPQYYQWVQRLFSKRPYLFYYLTETDMVSRWFLLCLADIDISSVNKPTTLIDTSSSFNNELISLIVQKTWQYAIQMGNTNEELKDLFNKLNFAIFPYKVEFNHEDESISLYCLEKNK